LRINYSAAESIPYVVYSLTINPHAVTVSVTAQTNVALHKWTFASNDSMKRWRLVDGDLSMSITMATNDTWIGVNLNQTERIDRVHVYVKNVSSK